MLRRLVFAAFLLAAAAPARAAGWNCSVRDELSPHLPAMMETLLDADRNRTTLDFYIYRVAQRGYVADQLMAWIGVPREATLLWKPDRIEFGIPGRGSDPRGYVRFDSLEGTFLLSVVRPASVRSLRPNFDMAWVTIEDGYVISQLWSRPPARANYIDRRGRPLGNAEMLLPVAADAQALFTRMRAELERKAADPAANCRALPDAPPEEGEWAT